jgi:undecaprenyl-diphosphatase
LIAFGVGYLVIAWFLRFIATHTFTPFVVYRVALGAMIIILVAAGALAPTS